MIIDLPFPPRDLHPNSRCHWSRKARATKAMRQCAQWMSHSYGPIEADGLDVTIIFYPPDKRRRDIDGLLSSMKAGIDGIADSLGVDDSKWAITMRRGEVVEGGRVRFEIEVPH